MMPNKRSGEPTHCVTVVPSLSAARSALTSGGFDLVLSDYDLDDGKGEEFVRECRTAYPGAKVAMAVRLRAETPGCRDVEMDRRAVAEGRSGLHQPPPLLPVDD